MFFDHVPLVALRENLHKLFIIFTDFLSLPLSIWYYSWPCAQHLRISCKSVNLGNIFFFLFLLPPLALPVFVFRVFALCPTHPSMRSKNNPFIMPGMLHASKRAPPSKLSRCRWPSWWPPARCFFPSRAREIRGNARKAPSMMVAVGRLPLFVAAIKRAAAQTTRRSRRTWWWNFSTP